MLRGYQLDALQQLRDKIRAGIKRLLLISPTGSGKTVIASEMVRLAISKGNRVLFLAHRQELVLQAVARLASNNVTAGVIMAGHKPTSSPVQVASVQTLIRRDHPIADLIIVDEAHHATAASYNKIIEKYPAATVIGLTATPFRTDGSGLGTLFQDSVRVATIEDLTKRGYLVPARYWAHNNPDMSKTKKARGDFDLTGFKTELLGDPIESYRLVGNGARAIAFCVNVEHAKLLAFQFNMAGIPAESLDANTKTEDRLKILAEFASGAITVLTNCGILGEGYDCPAAEVVIMVRPTLSLGLYLQQIGRVLRTAGGKTEARVIDHAGNVERHGFIGDPPADLTAGIKKSKKKAGPSVRTCPKCYAVMKSSAKECEACRHIFPPPEPPKIKAGKLSEVKTAWTPEGMKGPAEYYKYQLHLCRIKNWKPGAAAHRFRIKFGRWPNKNERA